MDRDRRRDGSRNQRMPALRHRGVTRVGQADDQPSVGVTVPTPHTRNYWTGRPLRCAGRVLGTGLLPAPRYWFSSQQGGAPPPTVFTPGRRQGPTTGRLSSRNPGLAPPFPSRVSGPPPREAGPLVGGDRTHQASVESRRCPSRDEEGDHPTPSTEETASNDCGDVNRRIALRPDPAVHTRARTRQVTRVVPNQIGRLPEEFLWLVLVFEGSPPHLVSGFSRAGVPNRLLAGVDALAGRARLLAERLVDGLELFAPRGPRFGGLTPGKGVDPRAPLPERSGVVVRTTL